MSGLGQVSLTQPTYRRIVVRSRSVPQPDLIADAVGVASSASNSAFASLTSGAPKPSANQP
jgi:hypothetical protein